MASSPPSLVCPPTRTAPSRSMTSSAPAMSWVRSSSIFSSAARGSVTIAIAASGSAPIAKTSPSAWLAVMRPKRKGSSTKERKKSTLCTATCPAGTCTTAASSGASRPTITLG